MHLINLTTGILAVAFANLRILNFCKCCGEEGDPKISQEGETDMGKKSIQYIMSAVLWNKLGNEMRMNSSLDNFKRLIKKIPPEFYTF